jgi:hypothetical protein
MKHYPFAKRTSNLPTKRGTKILKEENSKIRVYRKHTKTKIDKEYLYSYQCLKVIDCLLEGKSVSQLLNNCGVAKLTNYLSNIRVAIGSKYIESYRIWNDKRPEEHKLADTPEAKIKLLELKNKILSKLQSRV